LSQKNPILALKEQIDLLAPDLISGEFELKRGDFLITPGAVDRNTYLVEEGVIRIFYQAEHEEHTIRFAYKDSIFAPLYPVLRNAPTIFHFQALRKTRGRIVRFEDLHWFMEEHSSFQGWWTQIMEQMVLDQFEREIDLITESPAERYRGELERSIQRFQVVPHENTACYLLMATEALNRLKEPKASE